MARRFASASFPAILVLSTAILLIGLALAVLIQPTLVTPDFLSLYMPIRGLALGGPLYDMRSQLPVLSELAALGIANIQVLAPAYPPPTYLALSFLGFFPAPKAALLWFAINFCLLALALLVLTQHLKARQKCFIIVASLFYAPLIGTLVLGQFDLLVLFGLSCALAGLGRQSRPWLVIGIVFMLLKPHICLAPLVLCVRVLWDLGRTEKERIKSFAWLALCVGAPFFSTQVSWSSFLGSLETFTAQPHVWHCQSCTSLPLSLGQLGIISAATVHTLGLLLTIAILALTWRQSSSTQHRPERAIRCFLLYIAITPLIAGYFRNYDFLILLVPLIAIAGRTSANFYKMAAYLVGAIISWASLNLSGSTQVTVLLVSALSILLLLWRSHEQGWITEARDTQ